jgi:ABC-type sugar transport system substrate-binding protein
MRSRKATLGAILALAVTFTAAACGDDADSDATTDTATQSGTSTATDTGTDSTSEAAAAVEQYLTPPEEIPLRTPLANKPEAGKTIIVTENPQAVTRKTNDGLEIGGEMLGWTVKREPIGTGPEDPAKAFDAALDQKPDAVLVSGNPTSSLRAQIDRAKREGITVLVSDTGEPVSSDGSVHIIGLDDFNQTGLWGKMTAEYAMAQGAEHVLVVDLSLYPILHAYSEAAVDRVEDLGGKATLIDAQITDLVAGKIPANIVSEIQRNPDIDWVLLSLGDMATGLDAALKGAGFADKVKIGGESASTANVTALKNGTEDAWTGFAAEIHGMYRIDALARIFNGEELVTEYSELPTQLLTPENVNDAPLDDEGYYVGVPDYEDYFARLWKVNG